MQIIDHGNACPAKVPDHRTQSAECDEINLIRRTGKRGEEGRERLALAEGLCVCAVASCHRRLFGGEDGTLTQPRPLLSQ